MNAVISFKAKPELVDGVLGTYTMYRVPKLERRHCNMDAFRRHSRYGHLANSDLFPSALHRIRRDLVGDGGYLRSDKLPPNVTIEGSGFLTTVKIDVGT